MSDDKVGYKKPPIGGRFKKGQSGNPRGRPKKENISKSCLEAVMSEKLPVTYHGKPEMVEAKTLLYTKQRNEALQGNQKAASWVQKEMHKAGLSAAAPGQGPPKRIDIEFVDSEHNLQKRFNAGQEKIIAYYERYLAEARLPIPEQPSIKI